MKQLITKPNQRWRQSLWLGISLTLLVAACQSDESSSDEVIIIMTPSSTDQTTQPPAEVSTSLATTEGKYVPIGQTDDDRLAVRSIIGEITSHWYYPILRSNQGLDPLMADGEVDCSAIPEDRWRQGQKIDTTGISLDDLIGFCLKAGNAAGEYMYLRAKPRGKLGKPDSQTTDRESNQDD